MHNENPIGAEQIQVEERVLSNHGKKILKEYENSNGKVKSLNQT